MDGPEYNLINAIIEQAVKDIRRERLKNNPDARYISTIKRQLKNNYLIKLAYGEDTIDHILERV